MRSTTLLVLAAIAAVAAARKNALKTKKYKCIEVMEDEDSLNFGGWAKEDEELRPIGSARLGPPPTPPPTPPPQMEMPSRYRNVEEYTTRERLLFSAPKAPSSFISPMQAPRDSHGNPLVLSPQHCDQVKHYAGMYGVRDVLTWVKSNCAFAKMYLPSATCEEINILIASCYPKSAVPAAAPATPRWRTTTTTTAPARAAAAAGGPLDGLFGAGAGNWKPWFW
ncbi:hypothetical protein PENTCL1PPCAC_25975 [Pristionchus entomophagus]|uniref:aECM cysteine-cradle domain-containing protein n=1 Tax=Pristionchus entomophagus TaxID=358040 RepID=A0AAV5UBF7_9BILA|nr:hypothetical protein PENTCL1PPCAC_25975 [Pristionchus entomophagus]